MAWFQNNFAEMFLWLSHILLECYDTQVSDIGPSWPSCLIYWHLLWWETTKQKDEVLVSKKKSRVSRKELALPFPKLAWKISSFV